LIKVHSLIWHSLALGTWNFSSLGKVGIVESTQKNSAFRVLAYMYFFVSMALGPKFGEYNN